jgi:hypothetical protein
MMSSLCVFVLALAAAQVAEPPTAGQETATVNVLVTDRRGKPVPSARVMVHGEPGRQGSTDQTGRIVFTDMTSGSYTLRVERDKYVTFEKDFIVYGQKGSVVAAISPLSSLPASKGRVTARPAVVPTRSR